MTEKTNQEHITELEEMLTETKLDAVTDEVIEQANVVAEEVAEINENTAQTLADIEKREKELFAKEVSHELKSLGLEAFKDVINVTDTESLRAVIVTLLAITNDIKLASGFIPKVNGVQDEMSIHEKNKDTKSMIGSKLAKLFK